MTILDPRFHIQNKSSRIVQGRSRVIAIDLPSDSSDQDLNYFELCYVQNDKSRFQIYTL